MKTIILFVSFVSVFALPLDGKVRKEEELYETKAAEMKNTVEEHKAMALWCSGHQLPEKAKYHWNQILKLDTDNASARTALDYVKEKSGWILRSEKLENRGLVRDKGEWKTSQQIEVENILAEQKAAVGKWKKKITALRKSLPNINAEKELLNINETFAGEALTDAVESEKSPEKKLVLLRALGNTILGNSGDMSSLLFLTGWSMKPDETESVRNCCVETLRDCMKRHIEAKAVIQAAYCAYLQPKAYPPPVINEAARILGELNMTEAAARLIDALVTVHQFTREEGTDMNAFGQGNVGISRGTRTFRGKTESSNQGVLTALRKLTNENFEFDQQTWRAWYRQQRRTPEFNIRRI